MKNSLLAQNISIGGKTITGPLDPSIVTLSDLVNRITSFMVPLAGVILFLVLVWGGYDLMMSQGAPEKIKSARAKLTTGIIGFVLLALSYLIVRLISYIFGFGTGII